MDLVTLEKSSKNGEEIHHVGFFLLGKGGKFHPEAFFFMGNYILLAKKHLRKVFYFPCLGSIGVGSL